MNLAAPLRINVFGIRLAAGRKTRTVCSLKLVGCGWQAWTADQTAEPHRLPGSGTFLFAGFLKARAEALRLLADPKVEQVVIKTNQDWTICRFFKNNDGGIQLDLAEGVL